MEIEQRVRFVSLTQWNWQFICLESSLWTSSMHMHIHYHGQSRSVSRGEREAEPSKHSSLCPLQLLWESLLSLYLRPQHLLFCWGPVNNTSATAILPRGHHTSAGSMQQQDPPLLLPLIHSFGRQNPSPLSTCLTGGKNRDEIALRQSIPSILFSISAAIHQPAHNGVVSVWHDIAPCPFTVNRTTELWLSTAMC